MNRLAAAVAVTSLALSGAAAQAASKKPSPRAKVYSATLAPANSSAYGAVSGRARMVDNKRSDSVKIHIKGLLQPGTSYSWVVYKVNSNDKPACDPTAAGGGVEAFRYKPLKVNSAGNASAAAKSKSFVSFSTTRYAVAVRRTADDVVIACGEFKRRGAGKKRGTDKKPKG